MVWSTLAPKWPIPVPFCGMDHQKSNFSLTSDTLSVGGCWGQPMSFFWKLVDKTQISAPPEATRHHKSKKILVLLSIRANLKIQFPSETPCNWLKAQQKVRNTVRSCQTVVRSCDGNKLDVLGLRSGAVESRKKVINVLLTGSFHEKCKVIKRRFRRDSGATAQQRWAPTCCSCWLPNSAGGGARH